MSAPRPVRVRAVPWKTSTEERTRQALGELPAYIKRARRLERAIELLFRRAGEQYRAGLRFVELRRRRVMESRRDTSREPHEKLRQEDLLARFPLLSTDGR